MKNELDKFREYKDEEEHKTKIKEHVDYSLLYISDKWKRAELEIEKLKEVLAKKNAYIRQLEIA